MERPRMAEMLVDAFQQGEYSKMEMGILYSQLQHLSEDQFNELIRMMIMRRTSRASIPPLKDWINLYRDARHTFEEIAFGTFGDCPECSNTGWVYLYQTRYLAAAPVAVRCVARCSCGHASRIGNRVLSMANAEAQRNFVRALPEGPVHSPAYIWGEKELGTGGGPTRSAKGARR